MWWTRRAVATPIAPGPEWTKISDDPMLGLLAIRGILAEKGLVADPEAVAWDYPSA